MKQILGNLVVHSLKTKERDKKSLDLNKEQ